MWRSIGGDSTEEGPGADTIDLAHAGEGAFGKTSRDAESPVVGRAPARQVLLEALDSAAGGRTAAVSLVGEAGSGKTLLVEWLLAQASDRGFCLVTARPVEGESDLPLAVMLDVLRPLRPWVSCLASEHRNVLDAAGGGWGEASTDRLLLAAATLALLAAAAEDEPVLLVIDDAHWTDPPSARALAFAIRRLLADRVAVVMCRRNTEPERIDGPWRVVSLEGLEEDEVAALLAEVSGMRPAASVVARVREETSGNPLAVNHLARRLSAEALTGQAPLPLTLPLEGVAHRSFAGLVRALPERARSALAVVAAAGSAAGELAPAALARQHRDLTDLLPAEEAGLVRASSGALEFVHPLYRAAALEVAGPAEVRQAHGALAEAAAGRDLQRHAWHRGLSVLGTDEDAASALEEAAVASDRRVGAAAGVGLRTLAVALSPSGSARDRRRLEGARALVAAGHHAEARAHLEALLDREGLEPATRADAFHHLARLMLWDTPLDSQPVATHIPDDLPPRQKAATLAVAALRARNCAELRRFGDLARAAHGERASLFTIEAARGPGLPDEVPNDVAETLQLLPTLSLVAESDLVVGAHRSSVVRDIVDRVRRLLAVAHGAEPVASAVTRGLVDMVDDLWGSPVQMLTWTSALDLADELLTLWLSAARARPSSVAYLLMARTELAGWSGDFPGGISAADRAIELSREVGSHVLTGWTHVFVSRIYAAMGDEESCRAHGEAAAELGARLHEPGPAVWAAHAKGQMLLGTGRVEEAVAVLLPMAEYAHSIGFAGVRAISLQPDTIEALVRSGRFSEAGELLVRWLDGMPPDPDPWHCAVAARCRVLVHGEEHVDELVAAIDDGALRLTPLEEARARLVAGTALRRRRRPGASRDMLGEAASTFSRLGAAGWLATAEAGLHERRRPTAATGPSLSHQELRVVHEIVAGATTREAAARLFCSPKTVEYHLTRVYAKLGVRSRAALAAHVAATPTLAASESVVPTPRPPSTPTEVARTA
ncbi:BREX system ATP-binding domain-containing protein [Actinomycetospora cinnamomea]|uniref:Regulatory LuxR family protein n=1 Tax=Actinomycetospora cinnamomea TaxID=663609 RepID=A0A2U1E8T6_9PSEU|nr:LuxR family transcriptional regulator [Actinomycetospora cinnamomea]PVY96351.1 regulatory LuxR family protein [Actinomycetospora cinnamomea]